MAIYPYRNFPFAVVPEVFKDYKISMLRPSINNCHAKISVKERMIAKIGKQKHKVQKAGLYCTDCTLMPGRQTVRNVSIRVYY